jgi:hypothetical protein
MKTGAVVAGAVLISLLLPFQIRPRATFRELEDPHACQVAAADAIIGLGIKSAWGEDVKMRKLVHDLKRAIPPGEISSFVIRPTGGGVDPELGAKR